MHYQNFDLTLLQGLKQNRYLIYAASPTQGETTVHMSLEIASSKMRSWLDKIDGEQATLTQLKAFGAELFEKVLTSEVKQLLDRSLGEILPQPESGLRIRLRLEPPELATLPWEFLYSPARQIFLAASHETPLLRYLNLPDPVGTMAIAGPVRGLVLIPELWDLNVALEKNILQEAFANLQNAITVDYLEGQVTPARIRAALRQHEYHLVHYSGHGAFNQEGARLYLNDEDNLLLPLSDEQFGAFFTDNQSVKLVVLNACQGGKLSSTQALAGMAPQLVKRGVPAVVAMQYPINDDDAILFTREFYGELCGPRHGGRVDYAISRARNALWQESKRAHAFGIPVLFMRSVDGGQLWQSQLEKNKETTNDKQSREEEPRPRPWQKILIKVGPIFLLALALIILAVIPKQQQVEIEALAKDFTFRASPKMSALLVKSLPVENIHLTRFGPFTLTVNECQNLSTHEILFRRINSPAAVDILPQDPLFAAVWFEGKELALKEIKIQSGAMAHLSLAEDYSIKLVLSNQVPTAIPIQLGDTFKIIVQKAHLKISGEAVRQEHEIERQKSFLLVSDSANLVLNVPASRIDLALSFSVPQKYFGSAEAFLEEEIVVDSVSFIKPENDSSGRLSSLTRLCIAFPDMKDSTRFGNNSASIIYLKKANLKGFYLKSVRLKTQPLGLQIHLSGKSARIEAGSNINFLQNVMPSILEWLWAQKKIVLIVSCLAWLLGTQLAIWGLARK